MDTKQFKQLLEDQLSFPCEYTFKFVIPNEAPARVSLEATLENCEISERQSKTGKYASFTAKKNVNGADDILAVYQTAATIPGIMSL